MLNYLFANKLVCVATSVVGIMTTTQVTAQVISEIAIDPYNDSSYQNVTIDNQQKDSEEVTDKIYVNAPATPQPPQQINGNLTSSNKSLPQIPSIGEPYSEQQTANNSPKTNNNTSVSVSPFDVTPSDDNSISVVNRTQNNNQTRTISVSPNNQNKPQRKSNSVTVTSPINNRTPVNNRNRRLSLKEVLGNSANNDSSVSGQSTNNSSLMSSLGNQKVYKVLVKVNSQADKEQIKSLYPEAFNKKIRGESFLQIGIFSSQDNVDKVSRDLDLIGFKAIVN